MAIFAKLDVPAVARRLAGIFGLAGALMLGACSSAVPLPPVAKACDAAAASAGVVGKRPSLAAEREALRLAGASTVRTLHKNDIVTMEYMAGRLNLITNDAGVIEAVNCG